MRLHELLENTAAALELSGVKDAVREAELLLQHCLNLSRSGLFVRLDSRIEPDRLLGFQKLLTRRCRREPLQYITGSCEFWSLDFIVNPAVLIPRPETEMLIEYVVTVLADRRNDKLQFLDLCTGSGVIATVLAREFSAAHVTAADISPEALAVAGRNIFKHAVDDRVSLLCADLFTGLCKRPVFDCIVTNPPYVVAGEIDFLEPEVRDYEPYLALSGGSEGMDCIRRICRSAAHRLKSSGWLFMEIGSDMELPVLEAFHASKSFEKIQVLPDLAGLPRVLQARRVEP
jgi:release factor glutamine methyltransferase